VKTTSATSASAGSPDRAQRGLELLRIGIGLVWAVNLMFIFLPSAQYWSTFAAVAQGYGAYTPGGAGFANYVSANSTFFAVLIAVASTYLAFAFLTGFTTRLACVVGFAASVVFLWTQWGQTYSFPGATDVGAHPLYLVIYVAMFVGGAGRLWSVDGWVWRHGRNLRPKVGHWVATPQY
jgi:uncharacterized membrane protein YphA (DoxX/SURF4 family)